MESEKLLEKAEQLRRECRFGDAINVYMQVIESPDATDQQRRKARVSIDLIQEINGFVNTDLMNP
ncbi:MAG: hypothetical protein E7111_05170 [Bacteroidales bacterium]|nr:hypothetical protein [Bacteroidales bacterium]